MVTRAHLLRRLRVGGSFLLVGALSTLIEIGAFNLFLLVFGWPLWAAKLLSQLVALINAYFGNREVTFRHRDRRGRISEIVLFLLANALCAALGVIIVAAGVAAVNGMLGYAAGPLLVNLVNLFSIGVVVVVRFALYHFVVFRPRRGGSENAAETESQSAA